MTGTGAGRQSSVKDAPYGNAGVQGYGLYQCPLLAPACGPSRSAIMTGIRPSTSGNYINKNSFTRNPILNNSVLLPEFFQQNGYYVAGVGKLFHGGHFIREVQGRGFDEYYPSKTQDIPSYSKIKFNSKPPLGGRRQADWGPLHRTRLWMTTPMASPPIGRRISCARAS